jgi:hypothetical protein
MVGHGASNAEANEMFPHEKAARILVPFR